MVFSTMETCWVVSLPWPFLVRYWKERRWFQIKSIWRSMLCVARTFNDLRMDLFIDQALSRAYTMSGSCSPHLSTGTWTFSKGIWLSDPETFVCAMFTDFMTMTNLNSVYCVVALFQILQECSCPVCSGNRSFCCCSSSLPLKLLKCENTRVKAVFATLRTSSFSAELLLYPWMSRLYWRSDRIFCSLHIRKHLWTIASTRKEQWAEPVWKMCLFQRMPICGEAWYQSDIMWCGQIFTKICSVTLEPMILRCVSFQIIA